MRTNITSFLLLFWLCMHAQSEIRCIDELDIASIESHSKKRFWLRMTDNGTSQPIGIPVIVIKGAAQSPVLGLFAALHGNELNGIKVIHEVLDRIDPASFNGTVIAIPGLNATGILRHQREFGDGEDLNRIFPGKEDGSRSQQYVWQIHAKILPKLEYLVDMHTASFGRENTFYVRADMSDEAIAQMARLQNADIILDSKGQPSTDDVNSGTRTMRADAMLNGIPGITVEYGDPQVFQDNIVERGVKGVMNLMDWLNMIEAEYEPSNDPVICKRSYWIYTREGGYLEVKVGLKQQLQKGDLIAIMRNPFGDIINEYHCPEDGIVIGRSSNPVNMSGGRIIHLGILDE